MNQASPDHEKSSSEPEPAGNDGTPFAEHAESPGRAMNRWIRPPRLATGEEREASRLELFYDLAYVLVVAELAAAFLKDLSWPGAVTFGTKRGRKNVSVIPAEETVSA